MPSSSRRTLLIVALTVVSMVPLSVGLSALGQSSFHVNKNLYSETSDPRADIKAAEVTARREGKHILLEFGGNWCGDCQVLDYTYHQAPNAELIAKYYVVVRVDIGHMDHNLDVAKQYDVPVTKGVPALAILDAHGKLLYSEQPKEFEHATPQAISDFLNRWKS